MVSAKPWRKIAAVLAADVVGYSRLMETREEETHSQLMRLRFEVVDPLMIEYRGRVIKNTGDGFLAIFRTARAAVGCAIQMQSRLVTAAADFPPEQRIVFRMAVNQCEVIIESDDVYGEGVNLVARLMNYADPGDVVISGSVAEITAKQLAGHPTVDMGLLHLKNITRPVHAVSIQIGSVRNVTAPTFRRVSESSPSIAVLPFKTEPADGLDTVYADGLVEEITHALSGIKELFVTSRGSTIRFSAGAVDPRAVGHELGVRYVLQGRIRRADNLLRIRTELSEVETCRIVHSDHYEGAAENFFHLQAKIALAAMKTIAPNIEEWELRRVMRKHPESITAYDLVLQARRQLYRLDYESHSRARGLLQQAIALDPDYAPAYSYLAYWYIFRVGEGWSSNIDVDAVEAARAARAAIDRDNYDALALAIYGHVQAFLRHDLDAASLYFERAIEAGPSCTPAWSLSSITCGYLDNNGESAVERAERGLQLSPVDAHVFWYESTLGQAHYVAGHYEAAVAWARKAYSRNPLPMFNLRLLAASLSALGKVSEAQGIAQELLDQQPRFRLAEYRRRCPFRGRALEDWTERLHSAGLPE